MAITRKTSKGTVISHKAIIAKPGYFRLKDAETTKFPDIVSAPFSKSSINRWTKLTR